MTKEEYNLRNLLAIIHRDGGHYTSEHGLEKATEDAIIIISGYITWKELRSWWKDGPIRNETVSEVFEA